MEMMKKMTVGGMNNLRGGFACDYKDGEDEAAVKSRTPFLAARIFGIARSVEVKTTTYGDSLKFVGEFRGINGDGEEFAAPVAYLVPPADSMLRDALLTSAGAPVNFAFDIFVAPTPKKTAVDRGYEFKVKPLLDTKPSDPLAALMASANAAPIPKKEPAATPAPALAAPEAAAPAVAPETPAETAAPAVETPAPAAARRGKVNA